MESEPILCRLTLIPGKAHYVILRFSSLQANGKEVIN